MTDQQTLRVAVVTGASAGIGKAAAEGFARMGWRVIGVGRDPQRSAAAEADVRAAAQGGAQVDFVRGDFCSLAEVNRVAQEIKALTPRLDVLVNNAGGVRDKMIVTPDGIEATMAANHFAPFMLTRELMPLLKKAAADSPSGSSRVIAVSSSGHEMCEGMNWDDLNMFDSFTTGGVYCQAKLANILFTRELDQRFRDDGIVAQSMHPGVVHSNFASHGDEFMQDYMSKKDGHTPAHAAETILWMATAAEAAAPGARYFHESQEVPAAPQALDDAAATRLWRETEGILTGLGY